MRLFKLITLSILFIVNSIQADPSYKIINLNPPGSTYSYATDINESGQVVGFYSRGNSDKDEVFFWDKHSGFKFLGEAVSPPSINNLGHVIGVKQKSNGFIWDLFSKKTDRLFIWKPEIGLRAIESPKEVHGADIDNYSINDHDQILVSFDLKDTDNNTWIWRDGEYEKAPGLSLAKHLSNEQIITGAVALKSANQSFFTPVQFDLNLNFFNNIPLPDKEFTGFGMMSNSKKEMFGIYYLPHGSADEPNYSFYWSPSSGFKKLPIGFNPSAMNNHGEIVGSYKSSKDQKKDYYLWTNANFTKINEDLKGIHCVKAINDQGQIAGSYYDFLADDAFYLTRQAIILERLPAKAQQ